MATQFKQTGSTPVVDKTAAEIIAEKWNLHYSQIPNTNLMSRTQHMDAKGPDETTYDWKNQPQNIGLSEQKLRTALAAMKIVSKGQTKRRTVADVTDFLGQEKNMAPMSQQAEDRLSDLSDVWLRALSDADRRDVVTEAEHLEKRILAQLCVFEEERCDRLPHASLPNHAIRLGEIEKEIDRLYGRPPLLPCEGKLVTMRPRIYQRVIAFLDQAKDWPAAGESIEDYRRRQSFRSDDMEGGSSSSSGLGMGMGGRGVDSKSWAPSRSPYSFSSTSPSYPSYPSSVSGYARPSSMSSSSSSSARLSSLTPSRSTPSSSSTTWRPSSAAWGDWSSTSSTPRR